MSTGILGMMRRRQAKLLLIIGGVALIIILGVALLISREHKLTTQVPTKSVQTNSHTNIPGATKFAQKVFDARLLEWETDESEFINNHRAWFTDSFLGRFDQRGATVASSNSLLFCSTPKVKPQQIKVTVASSKSDNKTAHLFITGYNNKDVVLPSRPLILGINQEFWAIDYVACDLF